jgi:hypothetical protein
VGPQRENIIGREKKMEPIIFIDHSEIREGKLEKLKPVMNE